MLRRRRGDAWRTVFILGRGYDLPPAQVRGVVERSISQRTTYGAPGAEVPVIAIVLFDHTSGALPVDRAVQLGLDLGLVHGVVKDREPPDLRFEGASRQAQAEAA